MIASRHILRQTFFSLTILLSFLLTTCSQTNNFYKRDFKNKNYYLKVLPPGQIKIADNFFCDQTEIRNLDYLEYLHWTGRVFGKQSKEYQSALPDTNVWKEKYSCLLPYVDHYLRHPAYRDYPVAGISQQQAINFTTWRTNRVFEYILIKDKVIDWNMNQSKDTNFTIERYFSGKYMNYKPDTNYKYYPNFRLPTIQEYKKALHYADSTDKELSKTMQCEIIPCKNDTLKFEPTRNICFPCTRKDYSSFSKTKNIYNLKGNVSEWTSEIDICVGGGWADSKQTIFSQDTFHLKTENYQTGFRNVCEWKRWTK